MLCDTMDTARTGTPDKLEHLLDMQADDALASADPANELNAEFRHTVLPVTIIFGAEAVIGIIINNILLSVFYFKYDKCKHRYLMLFVVSIDLLSCLTTIPAEVYAHQTWFTYPHPWLCDVKSFLNIFTVCSDAFCFLIISVDRYRQISAPSSTQMSTPTAKRLCVAAIIAALVVASFSIDFTGLRTFKRSYNGTLINVTTCEIDGRYSKGLSDLPVKYAIEIDIITGLCVFMILVLYAMSLRRFCCNKEDLRLANTSSSPDEESPLIQIDADNFKNKTVILLTLTTFYLVTIMMYMALMISTFASGELGALTNTETMIFFICYRMYFLNHVINPFICGIMDPQCKKVLCSCFCK